MNYKWKFEPHTEEQREAAAKLSDELNISPIIAKMLIRRGISDVQDAKKYFRPQLHDLHDPFLMKDMDKAVDRLNEAMGRKEITTWTDAHP